MTTGQYVDGWLASTGGERVTGVVVQINISQGGVPKRPVASAELTETGLVGDSWRYAYHGGKSQAVLLITGEGIDELIAQGFELFPGALGENLTTRGLDRRQLRLGQRLTVGDAEIELTRVRVPCATIAVYGAAIGAAMYDARVKAGDHTSSRWGLSGFYASVRCPGTIHTGQTIQTT